MFACIHVCIVCNCDHFTGACPYDSIKKLDDDDDDDDQHNVRPNGTDTTFVPVHRMQEGNIGTLPGLYTI